LYVICVKRFLAAYFWVGDRTANPTPDQATGMAVPDETNRYVTDVRVTS